MNCIAHTICKRHKPALRFWIIPPLWPRPHAAKGHRPASWPFCWGGHAKREATSKTEVSLYKAKALQLFKRMLIILCSHLAFSVCAFTVLFDHSLHLPQPDPPSPTRTRTPLLPRQVALLIYCTESWIACTAKKITANCNLMFLAPTETRENSVRSSKLRSALTHDQNNTIASCEAVTNWHGEKCAKLLCACSYIAHAMTLFKAVFVSLMRAATRKFTYVHWTLQVQHLYSCSSLCLSLSKTVFSNWNANIYTLYWLSLCKTNLNTAQTQICTLNISQHECLPSSKSHDYGCCRWQDPYYPLW